jgi:predicted RecB family nuclease
MDRGSRIDNLAALYTNGKIRKLPAELQNFKKEFKVLKAVAAVTQQQWALTRAWTPTEWFASNAWLRSKTDVYVELKGGSIKIIDHKTGKIRETEPYHLQLNLYATVALAKFPAAKSVHTELWFLDQGKIIGGEAGGGVKGIFQRTDFEGLKKTWELRTRAMLTDTRFAPRPGDYCRWCHFRKANGGPCKY